MTRQSHEFCFYGCRFVKDFSAADIIMSFPVMGTAARAPNGLNEHPLLNKWLTSIKERPAFKRALEKGGEFTLFK